MAIKCFLRIGGKKEAQKPLKDRAKRVAMKVGFFSGMIKVVKKVVS